MMKHFKLKEFTASHTADRLGLDNKPGEDEVRALEALVDNVLDPLREMWGSAIYVSSGYRSEKLNKAVGGVANSQHRRGEAADISAGDPKINRKLFALLRDSSLPYDQIIDECGMLWIHVSYTTRRANRRQVLAIK